MDAHRKTRIASVFGAFLIAIAFAVPVDADQRPNILLILADDLGFSDLGAFGGEIATPHLDQLAYAGTRFTNLHTTPTCSPTRAELLTGVDHHMAGFSNMKELITESQRGRPGYQGHLSPAIPTVAEKLSGLGYRTIMSGKWHLGEAPEHGPFNRGFQQVFALIEGGHNHFGKPGIPPESLGGVTYRENGKETSIPADFYSSDYFTDKLISYLGGEDDRPFFAYLSFTAPHWPLHAPAENIANYRGKYDLGWATLRELRIERQQKLGLIPDTKAYKVPETLRDWASLSKPEQRLQATKMEIYAAMVERLDWNIGRIKAHLAKTGMLQNTVIVFLSDNGAAPDQLENMARKVPDFPTVDPGDSEHWGSSESILAYGPNWAQAASAPRRLYKSVTTQGGLVSPTIIYYERLQNRPAIEASFVTVRDIAPTIVELAGGQVPDSQNSMLRLSGRSLVPLLTGTADRVHGYRDVFVWELFGQRAVRRGNWKLTYISRPNGSGKWELYDLTVDLEEARDVSEQNPKLVHELKGAWRRYQAQMQIILEEQVVSPHNADIVSPGNGS